jgi:4'-phosphopantetheinyl transferase
MDSYLEIPVTTPAIEPGQLHAWRLRLTPPEPVLPALHDLLSPEERAKAARFRFDRDRHRHVAARAGLRLVLASYLGCEPAAVLMQPGALGKPLLTGPGRVGSISFNLSHSGDWGLLGIGRQRHIGVDIEQHRDIPDLEEVAPSVLSEGELAALRARPPRERVSCFLQMWTRKEAVVKATGAGIGTALDEIEIDPADPARSEEFTVEAGLPDMPPLFGRSFALDADYFGAVVCEDAPPRIAWYEYPAG